MDSIFNEFDKAALNRFIGFISKHVDIDFEKAFNFANNSLKYYRGDKEARAELRYLLEIENRWYKSLEEGPPDYSVYDDKYFLVDLWACWIIYSRKYLLAIKSKIAPIIGDIEVIADLGCGFGYTTAALKEIFGGASVIGTNFEGGYQYLIAEEIGKLRDFSVAPKISGKVDLIFASEYFEHIERPIEHLLEILEIGQPKYLIIANSFNTISTGHFIEYKNLEDRLGGKATSRLFNKTLREKGYSKIDLGLWNNRPTFWRKNAT